MIYSSRLGRYLTPEEEASVNDAVALWVQENVEVRQAADGTKRFRLSPQETTNEEPT